MKTIPTMLLVLVAVVTISPHSSALAQLPPAASATSTSPADATDAAVMNLVDAPLETHQRELLVLAFDVACAIPVTPHIKTRCARQEDVVEAALKLDQQRFALECTKTIDDWRQGSAYADLAFHCAQRGKTSEAREFMEKAIEIARWAEDWRRDRIRTKVARTYVWLGEDRSAAELEANAISAESGRTESIRALLAKDDQFDVRMTALEDRFASGDTDLIRGALETCLILYDRFYAQAERRKLIEGVVRLQAESMPISLRFDMFLELARHAVKHEDSSAARTFAEQARSYLYSFGWESGDKVAFLGRLAKVLHLAGQTPEAERELNAALALYFIDRDAIITGDHAGALIPVAEAYHLMGRMGEAFSIYNRAIEEACDIINSRMRANNLTAICLSMAEHKVMPGESLWKSLRDTRAGLVDPW